MYPMSFIRAILIKELVLIALIEGNYLLFD
jgi:hypothetical protein